MPIDNNAVERDLRALTIGRNNWLFVGSPQAGPRAAVLYTLVSSAARHDLDVWAYLRDVLERLTVLRDRGGVCSDQLRGGDAPPLDDALASASAEQRGSKWRTLPTDDELTPLLPDVWAKSHPEAIRSYRQHERDRRASAKRSRREKRRALAQARAAQKPPG